MNENELYFDNLIISNKNPLPVATLVIIQPNTIVPKRIVEAEVIDEENSNCKQICLIS